MSALLATLHGLQNALREHPRLHLIQVVSQFDSFCATDEDTDYSSDGRDDDDDFYRLAVQNLRRNFPAIYADVLQMEQRGEEYDQIDTFISQRLAAYDLENNEIETLATGWISVPLIGISFYNYDSWEHNDTVVNLIRLLDPEAPETFSWHYDPSKAFAETQYYLLHDLEQQIEHPVLSTLHYYFNWFCSTSGSTAIDVSYDEDEGLQSPVWDNPGDIELAQEINRERRLYEKEIDRAETCYLNDPVIWQELKANIARIHKHIAKVGLRQNYAANPSKPRLYWRHAIAAGGTSGTDA